MSSTKEKNIKVRQEIIPKKLGSAYLMIGVTTFVLGTIFILFGLWIDRLSGRYPVFTIVLTVISFPLVLFINSKIIKNSIEKPRQ
jgi:F0F1-type ATP synthase assembly protein I